VDKTKFQSSGQRNLDLVAHRSTVLSLGQTLVVELNCTSSIWLIKVVPQWINYDVMMPGEVIITSFPNGIRSVNPLKNPAITKKKVIDNGLCMW